MAEGQEILDRIRALVEEEKSLRDQRADDSIQGDDERSRLSALEVELDQCWDLLRQRQALREFGKDPKDAEVRPSSVVENYRG